MSRRTKRPTKREARDGSGTVLAERQHSQRCRFAFGLPCTCTPAFVVVGTARSKAELGALLRERAERLESIKAEIVRGFS